MRTLVGVPRWFPSMKSTRFGCFPSLSAFECARRRGTHTDTPPTQPASHPQFQVSPVVRLQAGRPCWTGPGGGPCVHLNRNSLECRRHANLLLAVWREWQPLVVFTVVWRWSDHTLCFNNSNILTLFPSVIVASEAFGTVISPKRHVVSLQPVTSLRWTGIYLNMWIWSYWVKLLVQRTFCSLGAHTLTM